MFHNVCVDVFVRRLEKAGLRNSILCFAEEIVSFLDGHTLSRLPGVCQRKSNANRNLFSNQALRNFNRCPQRRFSVTTISVLKFRTYRVTS
jgi:hypothetical protein